jgi:hypothetical protein
MSTCLEYQEKMSAFCDGQLPDQDWLAMETHLSKCSKCFNENAHFQKSLNVFDSIGLPVTEIKVSQGFSQNVMARVKMGQVKTADAGGVWKRASFFAIAFVIYTIYAFSASKSGSNDLQVSFNREMLVFKLLIAGLGLGFVFFSNELVGINNKVLKRFSEQYDRIRQSDLLMSRIIGLSIFIALVGHKVIFSAMSPVFKIFN